MEQAYSERFGRQRIIERPRLTRLLDESPSRILMLIAPAGYGKTILARQWLATRRHGWYRGTSGSADVAALAIGLSQASQPIVPGAGERMQERLRATGTPEEDVVALAELLAEDLQEWPEDAWLAFDDYQFASRSRFSERFIDLLVTLTKVRILLTSRARPSWATSRRLLYGEVHEVGRTFLAMTDDEALEVLGDRDTTAPGLVALAEGWPAVIGLASLTEGRQLPEGAVPAALYDYFAEELYQAASPELQWRLSQLALVPSVTESLAEAVLGAGAGEVLSQGLELGFFTSPARGLYDTHPLLRTFLETKFREAPASETTPITHALGRALADRELWDDALDLLERFFSETLFLELIELVLPLVLRDGRLPTLDRWVDLGIDRGVDAAVLNLAEAESCFRKGERVRAEALALQASRRMSAEDPLTARAMLIAGASAHLSTRDEQAAEYYASARDLALDDADRWEAVRGQLLAASTLESGETHKLLDELGVMNDGRADKEVALATIRFSVSTRLGIGRIDPDVLEPAAHLALRVRNPLVRTSFLYVQIQALIHAARYAEALKVAASIAATAKEERLPFLMPYISLSKARCEYGLRSFSRSVRLLDMTQKIARRSSDSYVIVETLLTRARLLLAQGSPEMALMVLEPLPDYAPARGEFGEYLSVMALAEALTGDLAKARAHIAAALEHTQSIHVQALAPCLAALLEFSADSACASEMAFAAYDAIRATGDINTFVTAYRSYPRLLEAGLSEPATRRWITDVLVKSRDDQLASKLGLARRARRPAEEVLSAREREVFDLLVQGLTNRQIARALWISEGTAKVHLRHIYEKLGVRTRVEAVMKAELLREPDQATSASDLSE